MLLLVHKALPSLEIYTPRNIGRLLSPRHYYKARETVRAGFLWAADNDAFAEWNQRRYRKMLGALEGIPGCLFVTAPDVVADARATRAEFERWRLELAMRGFPIGYVAQDGEEIEHVPWEGISALFIGGTTEWKLGSEAALLIRAARARGKWVHMGRVNTARRIELAGSLRVDSIDGTSLSRYSARWLADFAEKASHAKQGSLLH